LRARGGFDVDIAWKEGRLTRATLQRVSGAGQGVLRYRTQTVPIELKSNEKAEWDGGPALLH
jgi:alpha-L-fucosidase 2